MLEIRFARSVLRAAALLLIVMLLAKLYVLLELSLDSCPVCHKALTHDSECPITLAWSLNANPQATIGPDLTHVGSRLTLAAGWLQHDSANLHAWVVNAPLESVTRSPRAIKA